MNPILVKLLAEQSLAKIPKPVEHVPSVPFTPRVKTVLALAVKEAKHLNFGYVGTEHLLVGLMREGKSIVAEYLKALGVTLEDCLAILEFSKNDSKTTDFLEASRTLRKAAGMAEPSDQPSEHQKHVDLNLEMTKKFYESKVENSI